MRELFVYYRVRPADAAAAGVEVRHLQATLRAQHPGLQARWLQRPVEPDQAQTWMETYAIAGGIGADLQAQIDSAAAVLLPFIDGPRRTEVFVACVS